MGAHAKLGASSAKRWLTCPGSVILSEGIPDSTSPQAHEGSAAHALAEHCLLQGHEPFEYLGEPVPHPDYQDVEVSADMVDAVTVYTDHVNAYPVPINKNRLEVRVKLEQLGDWAKDMFGTCDHLLWLSSTRTLYVDDYKHGAGVFVSVDDPQVKYYAVGALLQGGVLAVADKVVLSIIQPRWRGGDAPIRTLELSVDDLMDWVNSELEPGVKRIHAGDTTLVVSEEGCRFCPAKGKCPKLADAAMENALLEFSETDAVVATTPLRELTPEQIARILDNAKMISNWLEGVSDFAKESLQRREDVTGGRYKLVAGKSSRRWVNEQKAVDFLVDKAGISRADLFEEKFTSPAKAEKLVGKKLKKELAALIAVDTGGPTMVPASDKRPAYGATAEDDFSEDLDFLE